MLKNFMAKIYYRTQFTSRTLGGKGGKQQFELQGEYKEILPFPQEENQQISRPRPSPRPNLKKVGLGLGLGLGLEVEFRLFSPEKEEFPYIPLCSPNC
jgi:hypothetical protein